MPTPDTSGVPIFADFEMLKAKLNEIVQKYNNLLVSLDSLNVVSLTADHIDSGTINAGVVTIRGADGSVYYQIDHNGIVAFNGSENTLEFDLATGLLKLVQVLIQTASGYPRIEFNPTANLIAAYMNPNVSTSLRPSFTGAPAVVYDDGITLAAIYPFSLLGSSLLIQSNGKIDLDAAGNVQVPSWSQLYSAGELETLQEALDAIQTAVDGKATAGVSTGLSGSHNHGITPGRYIMTYDSAGNELGLQQWGAAPTHSHAQT